MNRVYKYCVALLMFAASSGTAQATVGASFMTITGRTSQPIGHYDFCRRYPAECHQISASARPMALTPEKWQTMLDVNYQVNSTIKPETDMQVYGVQEHWAYPTTAGDCEDYALLKRRLL
ncbi:MAG TPA: transglutaminase-like cysteine peptidase, partial [Pararhizobium sp.]|nr:transglutaminase-like cysteine peptidase [Pararhizobium sp.]